ncbi:MAG TPA: hypothetical protein VEU96_11430 [Bryobacteraceae bacterium]|nr:hypothetical protein [Bryobacteraceae bacterium]
MSNFIPLRILLVLSLILGLQVPVFPQEASNKTGHDPAKPDPKYPVIVRPGIPSIWSMEQAHYLLNRLRANNDSIQTKVPTPDDLDPNAVGGLRLEAVQSTLNASAALNSVTGVQNQTSLQQFNQSNARHDDLIRQADALRAKLYQDQLALAELKGQQDRLKAIQAALPPTTPVPGAAPDPIVIQLADLTGRITALDAQNTATGNQITALTTQAGNTPGPPTLTSVDAPGTLTPPDKLLKDAVASLLKKTADSFTPKVQSSIALDNFLQMQYEIISKQLTSLRDEVGAGHRILFLEMPTSIESADKRWLGDGGEDKLAQSWWKVTRIYRRYKTEDSPCWLGSDYNIPSQYASAESGNATAGGAGSRTSESSTDLTNLKNEISTKALQLGDMFSAIQSVNDTVDLQTQKAQIAALDQRFRSQVSIAPVEDVPPSLNDADTRLQSSYADLEAFIAGLSVTMPDSDTRDKELTDKEKILRKRRSQLRAEFDKFLADIPLQAARPFSSRDTLQPFESACRDTRSKVKLAMEPLGDLQKEVKDKLAGAITKKDTAEIKRLTAIQDLLKHVQTVQGRKLSDLLTINQARIYKKVGGPRQIGKAFFSEIRPPSGDGDQLGNGDQLGSGDVRSVDIIPRQTAVNVNTAHATVRNLGLTFAYHNLLGLGLKTDYQRQRETYDQFMQQEAFASGFGKGQATFGWTFGPLPGSRVINSGTRNTYAVLVVPDDTTALRIGGIGCAYHRKHNPLPHYPSDDYTSEFHCGNEISDQIDVPDRTNDGGFWVTNIDFKMTAPGTKATVLLRGSYFSPQTTVLVNGRRLPSVLGIGKPNKNLDDGPADPADDTAISGTFENVNQSQLALNLVIPAKYDSDAFPTITLVAPTRAIILNQLPLTVNGNSNTTLDDSPLVDIQKPDPKLTLSGWQYLGERPGRKFAAHLTGKKLREHLDHVRFNGVRCSDPDKISEGLVQVLCDISELPDWEFVAVSDDPKAPVASALVVTNPKILALTTYTILDGVDYGADLHPSFVPIRLIGSGFTPQTTLNRAPASAILSYVNALELRLELTNPGPHEVIEVTDPTRQNFASIAIKRPPDKTSDSTPKETTVTTVATEKKVVKK